MSFDVFLQRFANGKDASVDRESVQAVLQTRQFTGPDEFGFYNVEFSDGTHVEFSAKRLSGPGDFIGCAFHIRGMSSELVSFVWEIARAGDMVILPAMENFVPILVSAEQKNQLPLDLLQNQPEPVVCASAAELEVLLTNGYTGWRKYRDQVVGAPPG